MNYPKEFENMIRNSAIKEGADVNRLPDQMSGNLGSVNPGDFLVYKYPYMFYLECKTCLQIRFDVKSHIPEGQWSAILKKASYTGKGVFAGYIIWFIENDCIYWISCENMTAIYSIQKSFTSEDLRTVLKDFCVELPIQKLKTRFYIPNMLGTIVDNSKIITEIEDWLVDVVNSQIIQKENVNISKKDIKKVCEFLISDTFYFIYKLKLLKTTYCVIKENKTIVYTTGLKRRSGKK